MATFLYSSCLGSSAQGTECRTASYPRSVPGEARLGKSSTARKGGIVRSCAQRREYAVWAAAHPPMLELARYFTRYTILSSSTLPAYLPQRVYAKTARTRVRACPLNPRLQVAYLRSKQLCSLTPKLQEGEGEFGSKISPCLEAVSCTGRCWGWGMQGWRRE